MASYESIGQVLCSHSCKIRQCTYDHDPFHFQAKFTRVMVVFGKSQSVTTANAKG